MVYGKSKRRAADSPTALYGLRCQGRVLPILPPWLQPKKVSQGWFAPSIFRAVLQVCRSSGVEPLKVYANISYNPGRYPDNEGPKAFINTLYNQFYIGSHCWDRFKIFFHSLIKLHQTRPFSQAICSGREGLQSIHLLTVDQRIFGTAPVRVWAEVFSNFVVFTIAFYPFPADEESEEVKGGAENAPTRLSSPLSKHWKPTMNPCWIGKRRKFMLSFA